MSFYKTFVLCMAGFLCTNLIFTSIYYFFGQGFTLMTINYSWLLYGMVNSINNHPTASFLYLTHVMFDPSNYAAGFNLLISPMVGSMIAGLLAETKNEAFKAWLLTAVISAVLNIAYRLISSYERYASAVELFFGIFRAGLINGIFYGFFCMTIVMLKQRKGENEI